MQAIVKTNYDSKEAKEAIENVSYITGLTNTVAIHFEDSNGKRTQYIFLDGYTEIILR